MTHSRMFLNFFMFRYSRFQSVLISYGNKHDFFDTILWMKHELIIIFFGLFSLLGVLFWRTKKVFFIISAFFISTQIVVIFAAPSLSLFFLLKLIAVGVFLWLLLFKDVYIVFKNKLRTKFIILLTTLLLYVIFQLTMIF